MYHRIGGRGGGVAIGVRRDLSSRGVVFTASIEAVGADRLLEDFVVVYRPDSIISEDILDSLTVCPRTDCDLNVKKPTWESRVRNSAGDIIWQWMNSARRVGVWGLADPTFIPVTGFRGHVMDIFAGANAIEPRNIQIIKFGPLSCNSGHFDNKTMTARVHKIIDWQRFTELLLV